MMPARLLDEHPETFSPVCYADWLLGECHGVGDDLHYPRLSPETFDALSMETPELLRLVIDHRQPRDTRIKALNALHDRYEEYLVLCDSQKTWLPGLHGEKA